MPDHLYENFYNPTEAMQREPRAFCYDLAESFITDAKNDNTQSWYTNIKTVRAIVLLLFCWNFAARKTKDITIEGTRDVLRENEKLLRQLEGYCLLNFPESAEPLIEKVFSHFSKAFDQTGASKALSLLNPSLFVMWDTKIRERLRTKGLIRGIGNGERSDQYLIFLRKVRDYSIQHDFKARLAPDAILAKKIDEYHYVEIVRSRRHRRR